MKIYIIRGSCGQWEDKHEWIVEARNDPQAARDRVEFLETTRDHLKSLIEDFDDFEEAFQEHDPHYFGAIMDALPHYHYEETVLI